MPGSSAYAVPFLPGEQPEQERRFDIEAGYIPARAPEKGQTAPKDEAHLYFMLHRAMHPQQPRRKLVFWLNGGPGCSSFDGALLELGALRIQEDGRLALARPGYAWNEYADVVYVDQPVGTGFSYVANEAYATSLTQVADEFGAEALERCDDRLRALGLDPAFVTFAGVRCSANSSRMWCMNGNSSGSSARH